MAPDTSRSQPTEQLRGLEQPVTVSCGSVALDGTLALPDKATGVVLFAHGSGSSRHSPRNVFVAEQLRDGGLGTLLIDLLTPNEEIIDLRTRELRFDIPLLAERLVGAVEWLGSDARTSHLPIGIFGASTGGGAALLAAAQLPERVAAVVSRGGRPDLAGRALAEVRSPTLLIVGERDADVIELNKQAMVAMATTVRLEIVPGATHLFEEPGTLESVAELARDWFAQYLGASTNRSSDGVPSYGS